MNRLTPWFTLVIMISITFVISACDREPIGTVTLEPTATEQSTLSPGDTRARSIDGATMVFVPAGEFQMGSDDEDIAYALQLCSDHVNDENLKFCEQSLFESEQPTHLEEVDDFWIDRVEVTNTQFAAFLNSVGNPIDEEGRLLVGDLGNLIEFIGGRFQPGQEYADHPAVSISWYGAVAYCEWVGGRLPTEAEWEYAARGPESKRFPWGDEFDGTRVNFCDASCDLEWAGQEVDDGYVQTSPVDEYSDGVSWCGALNLTGNVWEWTGDWVAEEFSPYRGPAITSRGEARVLHGGSWYDPPNNIRNATRMALGPDSTWVTVGFRCVEDAG